MKSQQRPFTGQMALFNPTLTPSVDTLGHITRGRVRAYVRGRALSRFRKGSKSDTYHGKGVVGYCCEANEANRTKPQHRARKERASVGRG